MTQRHAQPSPDPADQRPRRPHRAGVHEVLLRRLPHDSPLHRLGVGTKLVTLLVLTIATGLNTGWEQLAGVAVVVGAALVAARVPLRALPRLPHWFGLTILISFGFAAAGGGAERFIRLIAFGLLFALLSLVIAWTTDLSALAPALARIGAPLRRLRMPVDDWAVTAALAVRCLPLVIDEVRTVAAAHRQRTTTRDPAMLLSRLVDMITASMAAALRRSSDLGEVIAMRGGAATPAPTTMRPGLADVAALTLVLAASVLPAVLS